MSATATLRLARTRVVEDPALGAGELREALTSLVDGAFAELSAAVALPGRWALLALGSYARRELCPGSDVDVMLLHEARAGPAEAASGLWYPLWDAGFVLGHSTRTVKEALALADADLGALTALLDTRLLGGEESLRAELAARVRRLVHRRRARVVKALADSARARYERPGPVADMLAPDLKLGAGGLRDLHALEWAGRTVDERDHGIETLVATGYLRPEDPERLERARNVLLDARCALHRVTGSRSDVLNLQEQDEVAARLGVGDADALMRGVAGAARAVAWIAGDVWARLRAAQRGPSRRAASRDRPIADGVVLRDGRVAVQAGTRVGAPLVLRVAAAAAAAGVPIERVTLEGLGGAPAPSWGPAERDAFLALLRAGRRAVPVFEALDHAGVLARILPEWQHVRALPQRNAYHRFTVDRHLLEAVAECARLLDAPGFDGDVARRARADVLLLAALLHDIGKGHAGDHSELGARQATAVATRLGLDADGVATLAWLVRHHLLLAETATRRDLSEEVTITRLGRLVGRTDRLDLLYALTVGDSRATGPAAWSTGKAALVRELFVKTDALLERGVAASPETAARRAELRTMIGDREADIYLDAMPPTYATAFPAAVLGHHRALLDRGALAVEWRPGSGDELECTVVAPDRTGLLAMVTGVLALRGFDIRDAAAYTRGDGMALELFRGVDRFGRLEDGTGRAEVEALLAEALRGDLPVADRLRERAGRYGGPPRDGAGDTVSVEVDRDASDFATVIEVHAPDRVGLLAQLATAFTELGLDVSLAKVATLADRVVDVFYVRDSNGAKVTDPGSLERIRGALSERVRSYLSQS